MDSKTSATDKKKFFPIKAAPYKTGWDMMSDEILFQTLTVIISLAQDLWTAVNLLLL
jgi:hypothetical protein